MILSRRNALAGTAALLSASPLRPSRAAEGKIVMASWGAGVAALWRRAFATPFTQATGIPVTVTEVPDPAAAVAVANGKPSYNIIIAASLQAANLDLHGVIEELDVTDIPNSKNIPEQYWVRNTAGKLLGMPVYFVYYGIAFNPTLAKASDFQSWKSLADPKWKDQVSISRPYATAPYDLTLYAKLMGGDETNIQPGLPMLQAVAKNGASVYTSMAQLQQQIMQGEVTAAPFYSSQVQTLRRNGETAIDITLPKEGGLLLSYLLCLPKGAENRTAALQFMNDAIAPEKQIDAARDGYLPLTTGVTLPDDVVKMVGMTMDEVRRRNFAPNWYIVGSNLDSRLKLVEKALSE